MFATHVSNDLYLKLKHTLTHALASYEGIKKTNSPIRESCASTSPKRALPRARVWGGGAGREPHPLGETQMETSGRVRCARTRPAQSTAQRPRKPQASRLRVAPRCGAPGHLTGCRCQFRLEQPLGETGSEDGSRMSLCPTTSHFSEAEPAGKAAGRASAGAQAQGVLGGAVRPPPTADDDSPLAGELGVFAPRDAPERGP